MTTTGGRVDQLGAALAERIRSAVRGSDHDRGPQHGGLVSRAAAGTAGMNNVERAGCCSAAQLRLLRIRCRLCVGPTQWSAKSRASPAAAHLNPWPQRSSTHFQVGITCSRVRSATVALICSTLPNGPFGTSAEPGLVTEARDVQSKLVAADEGSRLFVGVGRRRSLRLPGAETICLHDHATWDGTVPAVQRGTSRCP